MEFIGETRCMEFALKYFSKKKILNGRVDVTKSSVSKIIKAEW